MVLVQMVWSDLVEPQEQKREHHDPRNEPLEPHTFAEEIGRTQLNTVPLLLFHTHTLSLSLSTPETHNMAV